MPAKGLTNIVFPVGGLDRRFGFQRQPPYTCADALNVRPDDVLERRRRGGSRPGLAKCFSTRLGVDGNRAVRMLTTLRGSRTDAYTEGLDTFDTSPLDNDLWGPLLAYTDVTTTQDCLYGTCIILITGVGNAVGEASDARHARLSNTFGTFAGKTFRLRFYATGATYDPVADQTVITATTGVRFCAWMVAAGQTVTIEGVGTFPIAAVVDSSTIRIAGNHTWVGSKSTYLDENAANTISGADVAVPAPVPSGGTIHSGSNDRGASLTHLGLDSSRPYSFAFEMRPVPLRTYSAQIYLYIRMDDNAPSIRSSIMLFFLRDYGGPIRIWVYECKNAVVTQISEVSSSIPNTNAIMTVMVERDTLRVACSTLGAAPILTANLTGLQNSGSRMGLLLPGGTYIDTEVDGVWWSYYAATGAIAADAIVASAAGKLYTELEGGGLVEIPQYSTPAGKSVPVSLADDRTLLAAPQLGRVFIADHGVAYEDKAITIGAGNKELTKSGVDWTAYGIDATNHAVYVYAGSNPGIVTGWYTIASVTASTITLSSSVGYSGTCSVMICRRPKYYDSVSNALYLWEAETGKGIVPHGCSSICLFGGRLVLAGDPASPHVFYQSRVGNPFDFDYGKLDAGRAVGGSTESQQVGQPIVAIMPHSDDYLIYGCDTSLWVQRGDLADGGMIGNLARNIGVVSPTAWCHGSAGETIFLSRMGLAVIAPGPVAYPTLISQEHMPDELINVNASFYTVGMRYDARDDGVHIFLTAPTGSSGRHWFLDWKTKGFWPVEIPNAQEPLSITAGTGLSMSHSNVVLGGRDGYLRRFQSNQATDDGTAIDSYVLYGPIQMGVEGVADGILNEVVGTLAAGSGPVNWSLLVGKTAEEAARSSPVASGTWDRQGLNHTVRPRRRGGAFFLKLGAGGSAPWAIESVAAGIQTAGRLRL